MFAYTGVISMGVWNNVNVSIGSAGTSNIPSPNTSTYWEGGAAARGQGADLVSSEAKLTALYINSTNIVKAATVKASASNSGTRIDLIADNIYGMSGNRIWNDGKAGHYADGSGYNADMLDGYHAANFSLTTHGHDATYARLDGAIFTGSLAVSNALGIFANTSNTDDYSRYFNIGLWKDSTGQPPTPPANYARLFVRKKDPTSGGIQLCVIMPDGNVTVLATQQ